MTKPIIVVKMPCKLRIQVKVKCSTSWPYLISEFWLLIIIVASDWPCTFLQPGYFCLAYCLWMKYTSGNGAELVIQLNYGNFYMARRQCSINYTMVITK